MDTLLAAAFADENPSLPRNLVHQTRTLRCLSHRLAFTRATQHPIRGRHRHASSAPSHAHVSVTLSPYTTPSRSVADVLLHLSLTRLTLDVAAPMEATLTPLDDDPRVRREVAAAAHQFAAVHRPRCPVALAADGAERARLRVGVAEVWRRLQVDEVGVRVRLEVGVAWHQVAPRSDAPQHHFGGAVELLLQLLADAAQRRHGAPARLQLARARHAVALALHHHVPGDHLQQTRGGLRVYRCTGRVTCVQMHGRVTCVQMHGAG